MSSSNIFLCLSVGWIMSNRRQVKLAALELKFLDEKQFWDVTYAATLANLGAFIMLTFQELIVLTEREKIVYLIACMFTIYVIGLVRSMVLKKIWLRTSTVEG